VFVFRQMHTYAAAAIANVSYNMHGFPDERFLRRTRSAADGLTRRHQESVLSG